MTGEHVNSGCTALRGKRNGTELMRRIALYALLLAGVIVGGVYVYGWIWQPQSSAAVAQSPSRAPGGRAASAVPVETAQARSDKMASDIRAVGSLQSDESVKIAPEVAGPIAEILFKEGQRVNQGDVLVKLDDALAKAEVDDAQARFEFAKSNFDRANALARTGNVTERARDEAVSNFGIAQAAVELARVKLAKQTILAPFSGVVGIRNVSVGAYLSVGAEIVNLEKIDPLKVDFNVPEIFLAQVKVGQNIEVAVDAIPNKTFAGTIAAIDPMVNINGRSLKIRAQLPNSDGVLRPGLFVRVIIKGLTEQEVVMVPESAVVPRSGEFFIYRVEDGKAVESKVRLGERKNGEVSILEGLSPTALVVTAGHQRLRNGAAVEIVATGAAIRDRRGS